MRGVKPDLKVVSVTSVRSPAPPAHLSAVAKAEWRRVVPDLIARGIFTDPPLVITYCAAIGYLREAERALKGKVMLAGKQHPAVRIHTQYAEIARRHASELGITPVSRGRAALAGQGSGNQGDADAAALGL